MGLTYSCPTCGGSGYVPKFIERTDGYFEQVYEICGACKGSGLNAVSDTPFLDYVKEHAG